MSSTGDKRKSTDEQISSLCHHISKKFVTLAGLLDKFDLPGISSDDAAAISNLGKQRKKTRRVVKDPLAPHRNLTSYIHFTNELRPSIVKNSPNIAPRDVARLLGVKWRALSDKQRAKYDRIAKEDFHRYKREMEAYADNKVAIPEQHESDHNESANDSSQNDVSDNTDEEDELASGNEEEVKAPVTKHNTATVDSDSSSSDSDSSESTESSSSDNE